MLTPRHQLLCLSGGGYRGLYSAHVLSGLENQVPGGLGEHFDVIAGTSIGAILATGLAFNIPAKTIVSAFLSNGHAIFKKPPLYKIHRRLAPGIFSNRYNADGLEKTIRAILGQSADLPLQAVPKNLLVVATNWQDGEAVLMASWEKSGPYKDVPVIDVLRASSAAPTYFPAKNIKSVSMIDGGIVANAPDLLAVNLWMARYGLSPSDIDVLSIGTGGEVIRRLPKEKPLKSGTIGAVLPTNFGGHDLFNVTLAAQESLALETCRKLLGAQHLRLDQVPSAEEAKILGLDKTGRKPNKTLARMAIRTLQCIDGSAANTRFLRTMLRHKPTT